MTAKTQPPAPQLALIALSKAADGGTWDFQEEMTEFYNDEDGNSCGGHPTGNYYIWDKDGPNEDDAWIHPHHKENAEFICALVNWFRSQDWNTRPQSRPEAELPELEGDREEMRAVLKQIAAYKSEPPHNSAQDRRLMDYAALAKHALSLPRPEHKLPELPTPAGPWHATSDYAGYYTYTADQLRAYGQQCAATRPAEVGGDEVKGALVELLEWVERAIVPSYTDRKPMPENCRKAIARSRAALTPPAPGSEVRP